MNATAEQCDDISWIRSNLKLGSYYWVRVIDLVPAADGRTLVCSEDISDLQPAKFTGISGGSPPRPTWDFIGKPSYDEMAVVCYIGREIKPNGCL